MASVSAGIVHWSLVINRLADVVSALSQDVSLREGLTALQLVGLLFTVSPPLLRVGHPAHPCFVLCL